MTVLEPTRTADLLRDIREISIPSEVGMASFTGQAIRRGSPTVPVATQSAPPLRPHPIYVDLNSAGPDTKVEVERIVARSERREHEMDAVIATLHSSASKPPCRSPQRTSSPRCVWRGFKEHFDAKPPKDYHDIFAVLSSRG